MVYDTDATVDWEVDGSLTQICGDYDILLGTKIRKLQWGYPGLQIDTCLSFDFVVDNTQPVDQQNHRHCFYCSGVEGTT